MEFTINDVLTKMIEAVFDDTFIKLAADAISKDAEKVKGWNENEGPLTITAEDINSIV